MIVFGQDGRIVEIRERAAIWAWAYGPRPVWTLTTPQGAREVPAQLVSAVYPELAAYLPQE